MTASKILVTGGTGFVGRSLVNVLTAAGMSVRVISRSGTTSEQPNLAYWRGDLTRLGDLKAAMQGCDVVFHCAAEKVNEDVMKVVNVTATRHLFELARDLRIQYFCHLSSVGVFGATRLKRVDESAACNPVNRYEETKLAAEEIVGEGLDEGRVVVLRPTNIFDATTLRPMLQKSFWSQMRDFLKGRECAHFVYVKDVVAAATFWMHAPPTMPVETFIVSSDEETGNTHKEIQAFLAARTNTAPRPSNLSAPVFFPYLARVLRHGKSNYGDVIYSSRKLSHAGFNFPFGLRAGLNDALDVLSDHGSPAGMVNGIDGAFGSKSNMQV